MVFEKIWSIVVVIIAILVAAGWETTTFERELFLDDLGKIYETEYDVVSVSSVDTSRWWQLSIITRVLTSHPLGGYLVRRIFDSNRGYRILELANAIQKSDPQNSHSNLISGKEFGLGEPLVRLSTEKYAWHASAATENTERIQDLMSTYQPRTYRSIRDYHNAYANKSTTPTVVFEKLYQFYKDTHSKLHFMQEVDYNGAAQAAQESTQRYAEGNPISIWDGVPVVIKPEVDVKGLHTTQGMQMMENQIAKYDDIIVDRFRKAGAIIVGQTVMHEKGIQPTGYNPWYSGPVNPHDQTRFSGGSSSGSAVAVTTGMVPVAIGFDGGGSVRIPAAWSGIVGLAVGYSRIPNNKPVVNIASISKAGPLTNNIEDAAEALLLLGQPISEEEGRDSHPFHVMYGGDGPPPPHLRPRWAVSNTSGNADEEKPIVRIGVFKDWAAHRPAGKHGSVTSKDDAVYKAFEKTLSTLTASPNQRSSVRFKVVDFTIPKMHLQALAHSVLISSTFAFSSIDEEFKGTATRTIPNQCSQKASQMQLKLGTTLTAMELFAVQRIRAFSMAQWRNILMETADVILTPTIASTALLRPPGSDVAGSFNLPLYVEMMRYAWPGNFAGLPGLAVPTGVDSAGLPISMQVICAHWHEADCLAVGREIEKIFESERPIPPSDAFVDLLA